MIRPQRRASVLLAPAFLVACCLGVTLRAQEHTSSPTPPQSAAVPTSSASQYADTDICKTCHQEVWDKHFAGTPHSALLKGDQHGCQGCHGPAQAHVDGGGDVTKIIRFEKLSPARRQPSVPSVISPAWRRRTSPSPNTCRMA